jgi:hypothetical protein
MRTLLPGIALLALASVALAQSPVEVQVRQVSADGHELTVQLPATITQDQAQAALLPVAQQVCAGRRAEMGRYRFESTAALSPGGGTPALQTFTQQVQCVGTPAIATDRGVPAPATPPSDDDKRRVTELTLAYLAAKDRGDFTAARALFEPQAANLLDSPRSRADREAFNAASGQPEQREVIRLTWYDDPAGAPSLGRYVAADYRGDYAHAGFYCGFAVWLLQPDGGFRIVRIEEGVLTDDVARPMAPGSLADARSQLGCRD